MKKKYICIVLASNLILGSATLAFAATDTTGAATPTGKAATTTTETATTSSAVTTTGSAVLTTDSAVTITNSAVTTTNSAVTATDSAITTTDSAVTASDSAITNSVTPEKTATKTLSLKEAIQIMKTTGTSAETAALHRQADVAVGNGYSETVSKIKKTQDNLDLLSSLPDSWVESNYGESVVEMAYQAQLAGVSSNNKKIMQLRRDFARNNTENNYQAELNQIEADTISIYYKVLLAQDNLNIAKENLTTQQKTLKNVQAKKDVGLLSKKDVLQAQSAVADAESAVRSADTKLKYAKMSFNYLLGYNVQQEVVFTDTLDNIAAAAAEAVSADTAVNNALDNRIELKGAKLAVQVYEILLEDVKAYPKNSSTYLNAQINLAEAQKTSKDAYSKIEIDIRNKADLVQDKKAAVEAAKELLTYATEGVRLVQLTNEEGLSTVEELLAAQVNVYKAKLNLANANSDYALALKSYEFAQGVGTSRIPL
ncbi:TolC family protein [Aminipila butyrica]|uniref:TolC family protein n=1 Tax=Aminipila butyrica TaxID=433296 RepID=A0A858BPQ2_9FIRM|nr:TolC family protein [Aminipila butyrica]QIB67851.1 TolC family protein [Aminipila butyrica]